MNIKYKNKKLEKILNNERLLYQNYKKSEAIKIMSRMTEIRAAHCLADIPTTPPPRRHKLDNNKDGMWGIDYSVNDRIIIEPIGDFDENDLTTITDIKIVSLEDYHRK